MSPKQILYVSPCSERAGAEQLTKLFVINHGPRFRASMLFFKDGPFVKEMQELGVKCYVFPPEVKIRLRHPNSILNAAKKIADIVRVEKIDLVHSVMGYGHLVGGLAASLAKVPEVWFQHGPTGSFDYLDGLVASQCTFVNSNFTLEQQKKYQLRSKKLKLLYPANSPLSFTPEPEIVRASWGVNREVFIFGLVGRMSPTKGQILFVKVALRLLSENKNLKFVLIGSSFEGHQSSYEAEVKSLIQNSEYKDNFIFTGFVQNPQYFMAACDVIVNATIHTEGFGLTLLEAMQLRKPIIAPAIGGPLEIFTHGREGFFFTPNQEESLLSEMRAMLELKKDSVRFAEMGNQSQKTSETKFSLSKMMTSLEAEYLEIFEKHSS